MTEDRNRDCPDCHGSLWTEAPGGGAVRCRRCNAAHGSPAVGPGEATRPNSRGLDPFPLHALPSYVGEYVSGLAHETQTPIEMVGVCAVGVLGVITNGRVWIEGPSHEEPATVWTVVVAPSGERKSQVVGSLIAPLRSFERALASEYGPKRSRALVERKLADEKAKAAASAAIKGKGTDEAAITAQLDADKVVIPEIPRILAEDATPEALTALAARQGGAISIVSAEAGPLTNMGGKRYNGTSDLDPWLKGHAGEWHGSDRVSRDTEAVDALCIGQVIALQPSALEELACSREFLGRGILQRMLVAFPESFVGERNVNPGRMPEHVRHNWDHKLATVVREVFDRQRTKLQLSDEANAVYLDFAAEVEPRLKLRVGDLARTHGWGGKLAGAALRIAGIFHVADNGPDGTIAAETMQNAIEIARWFIPHAVHMFALSGSTGPETDPQMVLSYLKERPDGTEVSAREIQQNRNRFKTADAVRSALEQLVSLGFVVEISQPRSSRAGRPPEPRYRLKSERRPPTTQLHNYETPPEGDHNSTTQLHNTGSVVVLPRSCPVHQETEIVPAVAEPGSNG